MNQRAVTFGADTPVNLKPGELALDPGGDYVVTPAGSRIVAVRS